MNTPDTADVSAQTVNAHAPAARDRSVAVWDPLVRAGHWLLVAGFFTAWFVGERPLTVHVWAGYVVGAVIVIRVLWGFIGTPHARFSDFVYGPRSAVHYLLQLMRGRARRYLGHSPAGGSMVLLLLAGLVATTWTGIMVYAYEEQAGPMAGYVADGQRPDLPRMGLIAAARADDADGHGEHGEGTNFEAREEFWEESHEFLANFTLFLVVLHVAGVLLASIVHRENLVGAMFSGRKRA